MSRPWWGKERAQLAVPADARKLVQGELGKRPRLHTTSRKKITDELRDRRPEFTPEWDPLDHDAGEALIELYGGQASATARRLNRLPDKALVELLSIAGIRTAAARPAAAMVEFTVSPGAEESILVPEGFQIGAKPADGDGDLVVFETQDNHFVTPATIQEIYAVGGGAPRDVTARNESAEDSFAPLGERPAVGDALVIGLGPAEGVKLNGTISLGMRVAAAPGAPPPVPAGGVAPTPVPISPVLQWEARINRLFQPLEVIRDETANLWRSGIVKLRVPREFKAERFLGEERRFWLRLRLIYGRFAAPPELSFVRINMARVRAVRTIRDEILEPIGGPDSTRMQLGNTRVVPKSLTISIDETPLSEDDERSAEESRWKEVDELLSHGPTDRVFTVDPLNGVVTFGDGRHGAAVPPGFRNVRAEKYEVGGGREGAVAEDEITTLLNSAPFVTGVSNPLPASGGTDAEDRSAAIHRGPATIRSRRRAVTVADYALMAQFAPGADVRRAHAIANYHPLFPGGSIPGVVGVLVVPPAEDDGPPIPDEQTLRAVSEFLSGETAPAGVEVVAAAPRYRRIRAEAGFVADPTADTGEIIRAIIEELNKYLHPLQGGREGNGWPFGGTLFFSELLRHLLQNVANVRAIDPLRLLVDGAPQELCADVPLGPTELFWPDRHQVIPVEGEDVG